MVIYAAMKLMTRNFDNMPSEVLGYTIYSIATTKPQKYKGVPILWLFTPTYDAQIGYNVTRDLAAFRDKMAAILKQRTSKIEDWVKANSEEKICLVCWEGLDSCHRTFVSEAVKQAGEKLGIPVTVDIG